MTADPRSALSVFVAALETHLETAAVRRGKDDPSVVAAYERVAEAFTAYEDALHDAYREVTPLVLFDEDLGTDDDGSEDDDFDEDEDEEDADEDDDDDEDDADDDDDDDEEEDDDDDDDDESFDDDDDEDGDQTYQGLDDEEYDVDTDPRG